jgi:hypothetical protein
LQKFKVINHILFGPIVNFMSNEVLNDKIRGVYGTGRFGSQVLPAGVRIQKNIKAYGHFRKYNKIIFA